MPLQLPPEGTRTPRSGSARAKDEKRGRTKLPQGHTGDVSRYSPAAYRSQRVAVEEKIHSGAATTTAEADKSPQEGASKNLDSNTDAERTTEGAPMEVSENTALAKMNQGSSFLTRYTDAKRPDLFEKADIVGFSPRLGFKYDEKMKLDYWKQETAYVVRSLDNCTGFSTTNATVGIGSAAGAASAEDVNNRTKKLLPDVSREKEFLSRTTPHKLRNFDVFEPESALNFHSEKNVNFRSDMMKSGIASVGNAVSLTKTLVSSTSHNINLLTGAPTAAAGTMRLRLQGGPKPRTDGLPSDVPLVSAGGGGAGTALLSGLGTSGYSLGRKTPESRGLANTTTAHQRQINTAPTTPGSNVGIGVPSMRGCIAAAANAGASKSATPSNATNKGSTSGIKQRTVGAAQGTKVLLNQNTSRLKSPKVANVPNNTRGGINHDRSLPVFSPSEQGLLQTLDDLKATNAANLSKAKSESDILLGYAPVDSGYFDVVGGAGQNHQHPGNKQLQQEQQEQHYATLAANTTITVPSKHHLPGGGRSAATTPTTAVPSPAEEEGGNGVRVEAAATDNSHCVVQKNNLQVVAGVKKTRLKSPAAPAPTSPASSTAVSSPAAKAMLNKARNNVGTAARINNERTIVSKNAVVTTTTKATSSSSSSLSTAKQDLSSIRAVVGAPPLSARRVGAKTNDGDAMAARRGGAVGGAPALGKNAIISTKGNNPTASIAGRPQKIGTTAVTSSSYVGAHASSSTAGHGPLHNKQRAAPGSANAKAGPGTEGTFSGNTRAKTKLVGTSSPRRTGAVVPTRGASGTAKSTAAVAALRSEATRLAPPVRPEKKAVASRSPTRNGINKQRTVTKDANQLSNVAGVSRRPPETQPITSSRGVMGAKAPKKAAAPTSLNKASLNGEKPKKITTEEGFATDTARISASHRTKNKPAVPSFRPSSRATETTSSTTVETNKTTTSSTLRRRGNVPFSSSSSTRNLSAKKSPRQPHPQFVELEAPPAVPNERVLEQVEFLPAAVPPDEEGDPHEDPLQDREVVAQDPEHQVQTDPNIHEVDDRMLSVNEKSFSLLSLSKENITLEQSHLQQEDEPDDSQLRELLQDDLMRNIEDRIQQLDPDEEDTPRPFMAVEEKIGEEVDVEKMVVPTDQSVEEHNQNVNRDVLLSSRLSRSRESAMLSFRQSSTSVQPPDRGRETDNSDSDNSDNQVD